MSENTLFLTDPLYAYMKDISVREPGILAKLRQETSHDPMHSMQISPEQGQFMSLLIRLIGAVKTIEIGVFTGYSSLCVAIALPQSGKMIACDISEKWTAIARRYWREAGVSSKIDLHLAPAVQTLNDLMRRKADIGSFDFAFIDADKENYDNYYEYCMALLRPGGLMLLDNVFWHGRVADASIRDEATNHLRMLNKKIHADQRVDVSIVPIGDGLTMVRKK